MSGENPTVVFPEKDQLSQKDLEKGVRTERKSRIKQIQPQYLPQSTLQYRTFLKRTIVEALQNAFNLYEDITLAKAKVGIDYQTSRANFPCIVVKYNERSLKNMGVAHEEWASASFLAELEAQDVTLNKTTGEVTGIANTGPLLPAESRVKGQGIPTGTYVKAIINEHTILLSQHPLKNGTTTLTFTPVESDKYIPFHHYMYNGDISLEIYGESSADRDRMSDAVVEVIAMGTVGEEGATFQDRIYATVEASQYPYSGFHFVAVNTDIMRNQGENEELAPWMAEDVWLYKTGYSFEVMGEFYSITPEGHKTELGLVEQVDIHPYHEQFLDEETPDHIPVGMGDDVYKLLPPSAYSQDEVPPEDYIPIIKQRRGKQPEKRKFQDMTSTLSFRIVPNAVKVTRGAEVVKVPWIAFSLPSRLTLVACLHSNMTIGLGAGLSFEARINPDRYINKSQKAHLSFSAAINTAHLITKPEKADLSFRVKLNRGLIQRREEANLMFSAILGRRIRRSPGQAELTMVGTLYRKIVINLRTVLTFTAELPREVEKNMQGGLGMGVVHNKLRAIGGPNAGEHYWTQGTEQKQPLNAELGFKASPFEPRFIP